MAAPDRSNTEDSSTIVSKKNAHELDSDQDPVFNARLNEEAAARIEAQMAKDQNTSSAKLGSYILSSLLGRCNLTF